MKGLFRTSLKRRLLFWFIVVGWVPVALVCLCVYRHEADRHRHEALARLWDVHDRRAAAVARWVRTMDGFLDLVSSQARALMGSETPDMERIVTWQARAMMDAKAAWIVEGDRVRALDCIHSEGLPRGNIPEGVLSRVQNLAARTIGQLHVSPSESGVRIFSSVPLYEGPGGDPKAHFVLRSEGKDPFGEILADEGGVRSPFQSFVKTADGYYDPRKNVFLWFPEGFRPTHSVRERIRIDQSPFFPQESRVGMSGVWAAQSPVTGTPWKVVTLFPLAELDQGLDDLASRLLFVAGISALGFIGIASFLSRWLLAPLDAMRAATAKMILGDLTVRFDAARGDEFGELAGSLSELVRSLAERLKMQRIVARIHESMVGASDLESYADALLLRLLEVTGAEAGAAYGLDQDGKFFRPLCSVGMREEALIPFDAHRREGELGRALAEGRPVHVKDAPPEDRYVYRAVAGEMVPRELLTVPIRGDGRIAVIFSLISLGSFGEDPLRVLEEVRPAMDTACARFLAVEHIRRMTRELSEKNAQLQEQKEELEAQAEELKIQAEELLEQNVALEMKQRELDHANRLKDEFLATMSHELRTPLHSILALSRLLQSDDPGLEEARRREYVNVIEKNGTVLLEHINDILDLSKIEAGRLDVNPEPVNIPGLVQSLVDTLRPLAERKGLRLHAVLEEGLPQPETDAGRLSQILQNLAGNAVKFTDQGEVIVRVERRDEDVLFSVEDTGIGISESALPHIFEKFRQVDGTTSRRHEGTGLGLAIAKKLTERLGGDLWAESRLGQGSVFRLRIPVVWKGPEPVRSGETPRETKAPGEHTVVVVDDDPQVLKDMRAWLTAEGYHVATFRSVEEAFEHCEKTPPALLFVDVVLSDGDGYQVVRRCRRSERLKTVPVVLMSGARDDGTARAMGAHGFVSKPLSRERVLYHVQRLRRLHELPFSPSSKCILVVEDDEPALLQVQTILEGAGYRTAAAATGREALDFVARERPDGVVLDLKLPDLDGWVVLERLRADARTRDVPVLVFTARELTEEDLGRLQANHIFQLVLKGDIRRRELVRRVDAMIRETPIHDAAPRTVHTRARVLIVEDHPDNRMLLMDYLRADFEVREAADGEEGLRLIREWKPDAVLLDISLPGMDGFGVAMNVRENEETRRIPLIAMTAHAMGGDRERILQAGFVAYVAKPFRLEELRNTLGAVLTPGSGAHGGGGSDDGA